MYRILYPTRNDEAANKQRTKPYILTFSNVTAFEEVKLNIKLLKLNKSPRAKLISDFMS